ncbi:unnamed protein product [Candida verbasci]|uniref:C3H1-type domain-containing protein n=1 Tax=Candida verbasci TaxID=1227364 RepID=A0A9W4TPX4_9ASCO|nr:unnamed protein product [Candida verbasci]
MSSDIPDSDELKLKYQEIAALKKSIAEKQALKNRQNQNIARIKKQQHNHHYTHNNNMNPNKFQNMKLIVNQVPNTNNNNQYISAMSKGGNSLYNSSIYQQEAEKLQEKIALKKKQIDQEKYLNKLKLRISKYRTLTDNCDRIKINGDKYAITKNGKSLVPVRMFQLNNPNECIWNGSKYIRGKNGGFKKVGGRKKKKLIIGMCQKGSNCKYIHDKSKIKICSYYLQGNCSNRNCLLSHFSNDNNTPLCRYYLENKCSNQQCRFSHYKPKHYDDSNYEIWTCRPFVIGGFCLRGKKCPFLHVLNCPEFEEDNYCNKGRECKLNHQYTLRTQDLISSRTNKYIREETETLVEGEEEQNNKPEKVIISSYTVDPSTLFVTDEMGNYQYYVDMNGKNNEEISNDTNRTPSSEFLIEISDSSEGEEEEDEDDDEEEEDDEDDDEEEEENGLQGNQDFVDI